MKTTKNLTGGLVIQKAVTTVYIIRTGSGYRVEKRMVTGDDIDNVGGKSVESESFHTLRAAKECYYLFTGAKLSEYGYSH